MAREFNIAVKDRFFLGEDKLLDLTIFDEDETTPLDVAGMILEWNMRKTDKAADPAILTKSVALGGLSIVGVYNVAPGTNTQRVRLTFTPADTVGLKPKFAYRHSLKRKDTGQALILSFGGITFCQATEH